MAEEKTTLGFGSESEETSDVALVTEKVSNHAGERISEVDELYKKIGQHYLQSLPVAAVNLTSNLNDTVATVTDIETENEGWQIIKFLSRIWPWMSFSAQILFILSIGFFGNLFYVNGVETGLEYVVDQFGSYISKVLHFIYPGLSILADISAVGSNMLQADVCMYIQQRGNTDARRFLASSPLDTGWDRALRRGQNMLSYACAFAMAAAPFSIALVKFELKAILIAFASLIANTYVYLWGAKSYFTQKNPLFHRELVAALSAGITELLRKETGDMQKLLNKHFASVIDKDLKHEPAEFGKALLKACVDLAADMNVGALKSPSQIRQIINIFFIYISALAALGYLYSTYTAPAQFFSLLSKLCGFNVNLSIANMVWGFGLVGIAVVPLWGLSKGTADLVIPAIGNSHKSIADHLNPLLVLWSKRLTKVLAAFSGFTNGGVNKQAIDALPFLPNGLAKTIPATIYQWMGIVPGAPVTNVYFNMQAVEMIFNLAHLAKGNPEALKGFLAKDFPDVLAAMSPVNASSLMSDLKKDSEDGSQDDKWHKLFGDKLPSVEKSKISFDKHVTEKQQLLADGQRLFNGHKQNGYGSTDPSTSHYIAQDARSQYTSI